MSMSTGYVRTHIYIEDMRTKKALSAWIPLVSVFASEASLLHELAGAFLRYIYIYIYIYICIIRRIWSRVGPP